MKLLAAVVVAVFLLSVPGFGATRCEDLAKQALPNATITGAQSVDAGTFKPPEGNAIPVGAAFCRLSLVLKPTADSDIRLEVWLPISGWNGKFQGIGNGGFAGSISYDQMAAAVTSGYATASTDTGHRASFTDAKWALGHPEKVTDFGYRAIHESAEKGKALAKAFYGEGPKHSYFSSCSNGGRQALMEAQRYPADYDGIIAGAPANYWTGLLGQAAYNDVAMLGHSYIPAAKLPAITTAALNACDASDGVKDGVIENPAQCKFDPSALVCKSAESNSCLTAPQTAALKKLYDGPRNSKGQQTMPGYSPGGEAEMGAWSTWITGSEPSRSLMHIFATQFYSNVVFEKADWDPKTFNIDSDVKISEEKLGADLNATNPDLKAFKARGGKLILYHGWSDSAIPATDAINYYQSVVKKMGAKDTSEFVRLYMVPGMQHCGGGAGPSAFGQNGVPVGDAQHDIAAALERWVEAGVAPKEIIATKYKTGQNPASGVLRTRPLCPYPQTSSYKGSGSTDEATSFVCK